MVTSYGSKNLGITDSGNDLLPDGIKNLPERKGYPVTWSRKQRPKYEPVICTWKLIL